MRSHSRTRARVHTHTPKNRLISELKFQVPQSTSLITSLLHSIHLNRNNMVVKLVPYTPYICRFICFSSVSYLLFAYVIVTDTLSCFYYQTENLAPTPCFQLYSKIAIPTRFDVISFIFDVCICARWKRRPVQKGVKGEFLGHRAANGRLHLNHRLPSVGLQMKPLL